MDEVLSELERVEQRLTAFTGSELSSLKLDLQQLRAEIEEIKEHESFKKPKTKWDYRYGFILVLPDLAKDPEPSLLKEEFLVVANMTEAQKKLEELKRRRSEYKRKIAILSITQEVKNFSEFK